MGVNEKMTAIADAIRSYTGGTDKLNLDNIAEGVNDAYNVGVYDAGYAKGHAEGKQAEQARFWDVLQGNGQRTAYQTAFRGSYWVDEIFNPKHPFIIKSSSNEMFIQTGITNTKQPIDISGASGQYFNLFAYSKIVTIPKLIVSETSLLEGDFNNCGNLQNITFEGTIGKDINLQWSPLTVDSMLSIINNLKVYKGTENEGAYTLTLSASSWDLLEEYYQDNIFDFAPDTSAGFVDFYKTVKEYIQYELGWAVA